MRLEIPELALVLLIGPSGAGKSTFARRHFLSHEVISSDQCRGWVSNDENDQGASPDAFKLLYYLVEIRLRRGLLTVIDATNVAPEDRKGLIALAKKYHCFAVGIVFNLPDSICIERNLQRPDRTFGANDSTQVSRVGVRIGTGASSLLRAKQTVSCRSRFADGPAAM